MTWTVNNRIGVVITVVIAFFFATHIRDSAIVVLFSFAYFAVDVVIDLVFQDETLRE